MEEGSGTPVQMVTSYHYSTCLCFRTNTQKEALSDFSAALRLDDELEDDWERLRYRNLNCIHIQ